MINIGPDMVCIFSDVGVSFDSSLTVRFGAQHGRAVSGMSKLTLTLDVALLQSQGLVGATADNSLSSVSVGRQ